MRGGKDLFTLGDAGRVISPTSFATMVKPAGSTCNLGCTYCYYLKKAELYGGREPVMDEALLELYIKQYIDANDADEVSFCWHGGEPLLLGMEFFEKAIALQRKYAGGKRILNSLQTNGMKVNERWCAFFRENNFLIGLSLDGPKFIHDAYRRTRTGGDTFDKVMYAAGLFRRYGVEFNTLSVVNRMCEGRGREIYRFFRDEVGSRYMQFLPAANERLPWAVSGKGYGQFLIDVFDEWVKRDVGSFYVQMFDATLAQWCGIAPGVCSVNEVCSDSLTVEHNGDVYPCDHFVFPETCLGNIREKTLKEIYDSPERLRFALSKRNDLPDGCFRCKFYSVCHGGCPEHRVDGRNVLCEGMSAFFEHVTPAMDRMRELLEQGKAPAEIMSGE